MLHFLADVVGVTVGIGIYNLIKWIVRREVVQSQVGGEGSVNVQVGGSIKGDATGELDYAYRLPCRTYDPGAHSEYY